MKPRSQIIATAAYGRISARIENEDNAKYATIVHKLPTMILQNGLAQTTGFLLAKNEAHHQALLNDLTQIFAKIDPNFESMKEGRELHRTIIDSDLYKIMRLTREALEISGWLRRYVQGILKIDTTGEAMEVRP